MTSAESVNVANPMERDHWMFGTGRVPHVLLAVKVKSLIILSRRICPGMLGAEREIWFTISRMLWAFNMYEIPNEPIDLKEYDGLSGQSPVPFYIGIKPRHEKLQRFWRESRSDCM